MLSLICYSPPGKQTHTNLSAPPVIIYLYSPHLLCPLPFPELRQRLSLSLSRTNYPFSSRSLPPCFLSAGFISHDSFLHLFNLSFLFPRHHSKGLSDFPKRKPSFMPLLSYAHLSLTPVPFLHRQPSGKGFPFPLAPYISFRPELRAFGLLNPSLA